MALSSSSQAADHAELGKLKLKRPRGGTAGKTRHAARFPRGERWLNGCRLHCTSLLALALRVGSNQPLSPEVTWIHCQCFSDVPRSVAPLGRQAPWTGTRTSSTRPMMTGLFGSTATTRQLGRGTSFVSFLLRRTDTWGGYSTEGWRAPRACVTVDT